MSNPLYALLIAYANDYLASDERAAASGGFLFINGVGAIAGPIIVGWSMDQFGAPAYWAFIAVMMLGLGLYGLWRMTRRATKTPVEELVPYSPITARATPVFAEVMQEVYLEAEEEVAAETARTTHDD